VDWLEDLHLRANEVLPEWFSAFLAAGAGDEVTAADAATAWDRLRLRPRVLVDVSAVTTATTVLGTKVNTPVLVAPTAMHRCAHPDGEAATAAGTAESGSLFCLSSRSGTPMAKIAAAGGPWWAQVYVLRDRELTAGFVRSAASAGAGALMLTGDTPVPGRKPRADALTGSVELPHEFTGANFSWVDDGSDPYRKALWQAADVTLDTIGWLAEISGLPVVVKGVLRGDDARRCVDAGAAAVVVSNHGGRQLDGAVSTAEALPEVVTALAGTGAEVYVDGGIRRGSHVLRALALGARAVFVGRPILWGLAAGGADGVRTVLDGLTDELVHAMMLAGAPSPNQLTDDLVAKIRQPITSFD
jgi:4-hydroxymandelate oxidase